MNESVSVNMYLDSLRVYLYPHTSSVCVRVCVLLSVGTATSTVSFVYRAATQNCCTINKHFVSIFSLSLFVSINNKQIYISFDTNFETLWPLLLPLLFLLLLLLAMFVINSNHLHVGTHINF